MMKKLAITLFLLICIAESVSVSGQLKSRKTNSRSSAGKGSVSREQGMNNEAHKLANQYWSKLIKCGRSYFLYSDDRLFEYRDKPHFSFNGQALNARPLSRVENLNRVDPLPIEWDGSTNVSFEVCRMNTSHSELPGAYGYGRTLWDGWGNWTNQHCDFGTRIWRAKGKWNISILKQITCDDLAGWGFSAKPRPTTGRATPSAPAMPHTRSDTNPALASYVVMEVRIKDGNVTAIINRTMGIIRRRLELAGVSAFKVERENHSTNGIIVKLAPLDDPQRIKSLISTEARIEVVHLISSPNNPAFPPEYATREEAIQSLGGTVPPNRRVLRHVVKGKRDGVNGEWTVWVIVESHEIIGENDWRECQIVSLSEQGKKSVVACSLNNAGAEKLGAWTSANMNQNVGVAFDGEIRAQYFIQREIRTGLQFDLTKVSAENLAIVSKSGALPAAVAFEEEGNLKSFRKN
jgi:hypothetical protein